MSMVAVPSGRISKNLEVALVRHILRRIVDGADINPLVAILAFEPVNAKLLVVIKISGAVVLAPIPDGAPQHIIVVGPCIGLKGRPVIAVLGDATARVPYGVVDGFDVTGAVQPVSVGVEMSVARVAVTNQHGHRVPGDTGIAAALDDDSTARIVMVDVGLTIGHVEIPLKPTCTGEGVVVAVIGNTTSAENLHDN